MTDKAGSHLDAARIPAKFDVSFEGNNMRWLRIFFVAVLLLAGCPGRQATECAVDTNCDLGGGGICTSTPSGHHWCAYPDEACSAGYRYTDNAGDGLSGVCLEGYTLAVQVEGNGSGRVSTDRADFSCSDGTCTARFPEGTLVNLSALATTGMFLGWSDACRGQQACMVAMDDDHTVRALFGTPGEVLWAKQLGSNGSDYGYAIAVDNEDNLIAVGYFSGQIVAAEGIELESAGQLDVYVAKFASSTGQLLWARRFGGAMSDVGHDVAVDSSNNIYISGKFEGAVDFGDGAKQATGSDAFVLKLDSHGSFVWARQISGTGEDRAFSIAVNGDAVAIVGSYAGSMTIDGRTFPNSGSDDIFVLDVSAASGATSWVKTFGGPGSDVARSVAVDGSRNVVLTGGFIGTVNFEGTVLTSPDFISNVFLLKLAADNGARLLAKRLGGEGHAMGEGLAVDATNNILVIGVFRGTGDFGCPDRPTSSQANLTDIFLAKYTQAGSCSWVKAFTSTGTADRRGSNVTVNSDGDLAVTGWFCGSISFGGQTLTSASTCPAPDMFAARFSRDGAPLNSVRAGGPDIELGLGIAQSSDGRFFVNGGFQGFAEFGDDAFTSRGSEDAFILSLAPL